VFLASLLDLLVRAVSAPLDHSEISPEDELEVEDDVGEVLVGLAIAGTSGDDVDHV
jgi:hypothetical protein